MFKVGVIGIGSIAAKAYLPIYAGMGQVDFYFCTRNEKTLNDIRTKYRWSHFFTSIDELLKQGIQAAFVHSATSAHQNLIERLIQKGIAVYVDKPIADNYESATKLTKLAEEKQVPLMTGFNRRFAPFVAKASALPNKTMIICQKNRMNMPGNLRTIIFDDFIHVVDTARFLIGAPIDEMSVRFSGASKSQCTGISGLFMSGNVLASVIMNRISGANQEWTQVMTKNGECVIRDLNEYEWITGCTSHLQRFDDWDNTLYKRGFESIIKAFLHAVQSGQTEPIEKRDALETHRICEWMVKEGDKAFKEK